MADGPVRQQARRGRVEPAVGQQLVEHRQQPAVRRRRRRRGRSPRSTPGAVHGGTLRARLGAMQLGMIGLGRMGANMVRRLEQAGHECVGYDVDADGRRRARPARAMTGAASLDDVRRRARPRRATSGSWCPAAFVDATIAALAPLLEPRRHDHRRRQLVVPRRRRPGRAAAPPSTASTTSTSARAAASTASSAATA